jgi:hypothetical protein
MSLFAMIDYGLILVFFICFIGLLLLGTRRQQQSAASVVVPSPRESPATYLFLAVLFLLLIMLTALTWMRYERNNACG